MKPNPPIGSQVEPHQELEKNFEIINPFNPELKCEQPDNQIDWEAVEQKKRDDYLSLQRSLKSIFQATQRHVRFWNPIVEQEKQRALDQKPTGRVVNVGQK
jgi:hypothetical protein